MNRRRFWGAYDAPEFPLRRQGGICPICPGGLERLLLGYGFKTNAAMKGRENTALVDYAPLCGILILAALMCFCIFLIANGAKRSAAALAQTYFSQVFDKAAQTGTPGEAEAAFSWPIAQRGLLHIAPTLASGQSSSEALVMPDQGDGQRKLALSDRKRIKPIWRDPRRFLDVREAGIRKSRANLYRISGAPSMYISRHLEMTLIALWRRSSQRCKISQREYASVTKLHD
jgi:hypothetical protein